MRTRTHVFVTWKNRRLNRQVTLRINVAGRYLSKHQIGRIMSSVAGDRSAPSGETDNEFTAIIGRVFDLPENWIVHKEQAGYYVGPNTER
jgi:hypothetical protein